MNRRLEPLSALLPPVVAVLVARHHQRTDLEMSEQTLTDWCTWLRNDLAYRAPELWPDAIDAWLTSTEQRFGERKAPVGKCGATTPRLIPHQRLADRPCCTLPAEHAGHHLDDDTGAEWGRMWVDGEPAHPRTWAAGLDDDNEAPRDLTLIDRDGDTWTCDELGGWVPHGPEIEDCYSFDWAAALGEAGALRETRSASPAPSGEKAP